MRNVIRFPLIILAALVISGSSLPGQTPATGAVMREKLAHSQKVLEALMTSNFALLSGESEALGEATKAPAWSVLKSPEYAAYSASFLRASQDLTAAANRRDFDSAAIHYVSVTLSCYQCHRYLKGARIAK